MDMLIKGSTKTAGVVHGVVETVATICGGNWSELVPAVTTQRVIGKWEARSQGMERLEA